MNRLAVLWVAALGAVVGTGALAARSEWVIGTGEPVFLQIRPRDPRSLIQGDFHRLRYNLPAVEEGTPTFGELALTLDERGVVTGTRVFVAPLEPREVRIDYQVVDDAFDVAPHSFLIEEGTGRDFESARFAQLRVASDGRAILVRLHDDALTPLGPEPRGW